MAHSDLTVVRSLLDRDIYLKYYNTISNIPNLSKEIKTLLKTMSSYYQRYDAVNSVSMDELRTYFEVENPMLKDSTIYNDLFQNIKGINVDNPELLADIVQGVAWDHYLSQLVVLGEQHISDVKKVSLDEVDEIIEKYRSTINKVGDAEYEVCNTSFRELVKITSGDGLLWRKSDWLNKRLGQIKVQTLGHVFARPDVGKTAFAIYHSLGFAHQLKGSGKVVLYCNNEESIERIRSRSYCSLLNRSEEELREMGDWADQQWNEMIGDTLKFIGGVSHIDRLEALMKHFNTAAVIVDQGPKIQIPTKETDVKRLQILYNRYREMAKKYDTRVIALGQADSQAEGKLVLTKNNLDNSKVGIPGECDWMLGIGQSLDEGMEGTRCASICKNKLTGKYGYNYYQFDTSRCQFKEDR